MRYVKRNGYYPDKQNDDTVTKTAICIGNTQSFLLVSYESSRKIRLYVGGPDKWCINCDIIKRDNQIQPLGYLIKVRYDILCSLEHIHAKGKDTKQLICFLIQYINDKYPQVKELQFNDLSTRSCDNDYDVNLAVMTYLYSEKTWYQKNFGAYIAPYNEQEFNKIKQKYNESKKVKWSEMSETIINNPVTHMTDLELETLYYSSTTWTKFFQTIFNKLEIADFCIFISNWIDSFILQYFNNLQGLSFMMPIKDYKIQYTESTYKRGGKRYTQKLTKKRSKDYQ